MVAVLVKIFGTEHYALAEDVVQEALIQALESWKFGGIPNNPSAWLYRTARNKAIDLIRRKKHELSFDFSDPELQLLKSEYTLNMAMDGFWQEDHIKDDFLAMMFACCHPDISPENQITFILKSLCGFSTKEIARAFITSEDTISKRIYRTKEYFRKTKQRPQIPNIQEFPNRIEGVLQTVYLMFNEGYNSTQKDTLMRKDVIEQSMHLCQSLIDHPQTSIPESYALMSLMCFHAARVDSRVSAEGSLILLSEQDRSIWDQDLIKQGSEYMVKSASGNILSVFHIEAAIAYTHCLAQTYADTNWTDILSYYDMLLKVAPNVVTELNRAVAVLELKGPQKAMMAMKPLTKQIIFESYFPYHAVLGEIHQRMGNNELARNSFEQAFKCTFSKHEKDFMTQKLNSLSI
jgi:RNA polymerase sigma factor (sigma-70 family)